jgi:hypothetical protein
VERKVEGSSMKIVAREFYPDDVTEIIRIFEGQNVSNRLPGLRNVIINSTLIDSETGKIVGYGVVNIFAEATMVLSSELGNQERATGFRELMRLAILFCKDTGLELLYAVTNKPSFEQILCNKYGFDSVPGALLKLELNQTTEDKS